MTLLEAWNRASMYAFLDQLGPKRVETVEFEVTHRHYDPGLSIAGHPEWCKEASGQLTLSAKGHKNLILEVPPDQYNGIGLRSTFCVRLLIKRFSVDVVNADLVACRPPLVLSN